MILLHQLEMIRKYYSSLHKSMPCIVKLSRDDNDLYVTGFWWISWKRSEGYGSLREVYKWIEHIRMQEFQYMHSQLGKYSGFEIYGVNQLAKYGGRFYSLMKR